MLASARTSLGRSYSPTTKPAKNPVHTTPLWAPQHTPYPAKGPVLPRGPGRSPRRKFWPIQRIFRQKTHTQKTYSTSFKSPRQALHECGHTGVVSCETRGQIGRWCGGTGRVDVRVRAAAHAGRAGRGTAGAHLGLGWTGISPSNLHGGQLRRARARRAAAQLQASCPLSAGQGPCPPLEQTALWPSEKSQRSAQGRTCQLV